MSYEIRHQRIKEFCEILAADLVTFEVSGHPMEIGYRYQRERLPALLTNFNASRKEEEHLPYLAALLLFSLRDEDRQDLARLLSRFRSSALEER